MTNRTRWLLVVGLSCVLLGSPVSESRSQGFDEAGGRTVFARFEAARGLAVDPEGRLYVADAGRDVVEILRPDGTRQMVLGGTGTQSGAFDTPSDVDPTNGQLILVADTYNGRVQRFSDAGQYLESLPVGAGDRAGSDGWAFEDRRGGTPVRGDGRPVGVARDDNGAVFVLDRRNRRLMKWSDVGQSERLVGGRRSRLQDPVALAVGDAGRVYVADKEKEAVLVYDTFGTFRRRVPVSSLSSLRAVTIHRGQLWIVGSGSVLVWERGKGIVMRREVNASSPLVDVAVTGTSVYLLTEVGLLRRPDW